MGVGGRVVGLRCRVGKGTHAAERSALVCHVATLYDTLKRVPVPESVPHTALISLAIYSSILFELSRYVSR